ncbi:MAG: ubiquitin carboxyl-terminal hydrolase [archaeon]|nr:ubiquitin carboxyl-terminal hydrolase [archaeon]
MYNGDPRYYEYDNRKRVGASFTEPFNPSTRYGGNFNPFTTTNATYGNFAQGYPRNPMFEDAYARGELQKELSDQQRFTQEPSYQHKMAMQRDYEQRMGNPSNSRPPSHHSQTSQPGKNEYNPSFQYQPKGFDGSQVSSASGLKIDKSLTGLENYRYNCFVNSIVQILCHLSPFVSGFLNCAQEFSEQDNRHPISKALYELFLQMEACPPRGVIRPESFINVFTSIYNKYSVNEEKDSQEFLQDLIQGLNVELNRANPPKVIDTFNNQMNQNRYQKIALFRKYQDDCLKREKSLITDLFYGFFGYELHCLCGRIDYSYAQFTEVALPLISQNLFNGQYYDVQQLIHDRFTNRQKIIPREVCPSCHQKRELFQLEKVVRLPSIFIISLLRSNKNSSVKNEEYVSYPDCIDLKDSMDYQLFNEGNTRYRLVGVNCHIGNMKSGHYFSYARVNGKWFLFNDSEVTEESPNFNSREVYALFYQRM